MYVILRCFAVLVTAVLSLAGILLWPAAELAKTAVPGPHRVRVVDTRQVIPSARLPDGLELGAANNNLDVVRHTDGFVYLAFRTAPHHFAGRDVLR